MIIGSTIRGRVQQVTGILVAFVAFIAAARHEAVRTFDGDRVDAPPAGFTFSGTAPTGADRWVVKRERDSNVLAHIGNPEHGRAIAGNRGRGIALAILDGPGLANVSFAASFKVASGKGRGGFVWRYQDPQNYDMVGLDLEEDDQEIALYRIVRGSQIRVGREADLQIQQNDWHVLKVVHTNETIRVYLGGIKVLEVHDKNFRGPGAVGLWAAGDGTLYFDNVSVEEGERR
jgi:hypothetical protein